MNGICLRVFYLIFFTLLCAAKAVQAAIPVTPPPVLPGSADVGRVKQQVESDQKMPQAHSKIINIKDVSSLLLSIPKGADKISFTLRSIRVAGSTVFENDEMLGEIQKRIGSKVTLAEVYQLANDITRQYWDAGYAFSRTIAPEQNTQSGDITIRVIEGYLSEIRNIDAIPVLSFRKKLSALTNQRPLKRDSLEETMLQVNVLAGQKIGSKLLKDKTVKDQSAFALSVEVESIPTSPRYTIGIGNTGSRYNGPLNSSFNAEIPDWLIPYGITSITSSLSIPFEKQQYLGVSQLVPLATGTSISFGGSVSHNKPGYRLKPLKFEGNSYELNVALNQDIFRSQSESLVSIFAFDYINSQNDVLSANFFDDRMRVVRASAVWDRSDTLNGRTSANVGLSQGLDVLNASRKGSLLLSRAEGESDFTKFAAGISREQQFGSGFLGFFSTKGQYAPRPLLSSEEFSYGGSSLGRGYDSSELTGDSGIVGEVEVRYENAPSPIDGITFVPYGFFDIGTVWNNDRGSENQSAASTGIGARLGYDKNWSLNLTVALPLRYDAATPPSYANGNSPRFLFQLQKSF